MPTLMKTKPKYRCQFCRYAATLPSVEKHEKICWRNPDRFCPNCKNTGQQYLIGGDGDPMYTEPCIYCSKNTTREQWENGE